MFVRVESTPDESTWHAALALTRLKEAVSGAARRKECAPT